MRRSISCTKILIIICAFQDSDKAQSRKQIFIRLMRRGMLMLIFWRKTKNISSTVCTSIFACFRFICTKLVQSHSVRIFSWLSVCWHRSSICFESIVGTQEY